MTKWEYLVRGIMVPGPDSEGDLNEFGEDGWELVNYNPAACVCIFKRPKVKSCTVCDGQGLIGPDEYTSIGYDCMHCDGLGVIDD